MSAKELKIVNEPPPDSPRALLRRYWTSNGHGNNIFWLLEKNNYNLTVILSLFWIKVLKLTRTQGHKVKMDPKFKMDTDSLRSESKSP